MVVVVLEEEKKRKRKKRGKKKIVNSCHANCRLIDGKNQHGGAASYDILCYFFFLCLFKFSETKYFFFLFSGVIILSLKFNASIHSCN